MSYSAKREYLMAVRDRYLKSSKKEKSIILDEFCAICGYHRKHAIRLLTQPMVFRKRQGGRTRKYDKEFEKHLINLWLAMGQICSGRLHAAIPEWLQYYRCDISKDIRYKLLAVSPATIERLIGPYRRKKRGISTTRKSTWWFKSRVPIHNDDINEKRPGFFQADTVAHCGGSVAGSYIHTLTVTDIGSTWTENQAVWTKNQHSITDAMKNIETRLPLKVWAFKSDSGSEFLNETLYRHFTDRSLPVMFFRSRPYMKNDNCHVEQKNYTHVRALFGYSRLDDEHLLTLMNEIFAEIWNPLQNFFLPSYRLHDKKRIGAKVKKFYGKPMTPYERLMASSTLSQKQKNDLQILKSKYDPFELRVKLEQKIREFNHLKEKKLKRCMEVESNMLL